MGKVLPARRVRLAGVSRMFRLGRGRTFYALEEVSLEVHEAETLVLLGPSGCGKTTVLRCIAGLEVPDAGEIYVGGRCVFSRRARVWVPPERRNVGMVFQSYALWPHMRVWENVAYPLRNRGVGTDAARRAAQEALTLVGLEDLGERYPGQLSGGQQQRVALARALVARSDVILLDEPLSSLDAPVREQLRVELRELKARFGWTAVYVTHDQKEAAFLADRIAVMEQGRVVQIGTSTEIYQRPGSPYVARFTGCVNRVRGVVRAREGESVRVETAAGWIQGTWCWSSGAPSAGDAVDAYWRPEQSDLRQDGTGSEGDGLAGRVVGVAFLGVGFEYIVRANGTGASLWRAVGCGGYEPGAAVRLWVNPGNLYVYPGGRAGEPPEVKA